MIIPPLLFLLDILCWRFFTIPLVKSLLCYGVIMIFKRRELDIHFAILTFLLMVEMTLFLPSGLHVGLFLLASFLVILLVRANLELPWYWSELAAFTLVFLFFCAHRGVFSHGLPFRSTCTDLFVNLAVIWGGLTGTRDDRLLHRPKG